MNEKRPVSRNQSRSGIDKDLLGKQKTASGSEWFIFKMDRGAERYPTGNRVRTVLVCSVYR